MIHAVLTGDLIASTQAGADATEATMSRLAGLVDGIGRWSHTDPRFTQDPRFSRARGDGWQIALTNASSGLRAALFILAGLRAKPQGPATRIAMGIGQVKTLGTRDLSDAHGAAFEASGKALDAMQRGQNLILDGEEISLLQCAVVALCDEIQSRWTAPQAEAMALALHPRNPTQIELANTLGISPQAVNYRLRGAGLAAIRSALDHWEDAFVNHALSGKW